MLGDPKGQGDPPLPIDPDLSPTDPAEPAIARRVRLPRRRHGRARPDVLAAIALGGMVGASARYLVAQAVPTAPGQFPWATFWTNLSGSFLLGFVLVYLLERFPPTPHLRPLLATGVLGAYTTMSTFMVETVELWKDGHALTGVAYAVASLVAGLTLAYAGVVLARLTPDRHHRR